LPIEDTTAGWVWQHQQPLVFADVQQESRFLACLNLLKAKAIRSFCEMPLTTTLRRLGTLSLGSFQASAYEDKDMQFLSRVADLFALALENALTQEASRQEKGRMRMLLDVNAALMASRDEHELFRLLSGFLQQMVPHEYATVAIYDVAARTVSHYPLDTALSRKLVGESRTLPVQETIAGRALLERETKIFSREDLMGIPSTFVNEQLAAGIQSLSCIPLLTRKGELGTLNLGSTTPHAFQGCDLGLLLQVAAQVAVALENARAYQEIIELKDKLAKEKVYLEDEIRTELHFEEIVGESVVLKRALAQARTVAPSDATVLALGETGTGKELLARAIHRMSTRKDAAFVKLNCAAIPTGLLESELFGHEKGAFTGAISQKVGRLELAHKGTLFLDEVGDIPLELQPKLLRVLQDQEFERLGSTRTIRVSIRLIAATNKDLVKSVAEREFRSDLYYRLNVFPIRMPALRERRTDIPLLVRYFVQKFANRMAKQITKIPAETMKALTGWSWPGNVRELENFLERSVILTDGPELNVPLAELAPSREESSDDGTLESLERDHIVRTLRQTNGLIGGASGAAARLGLKRTTLQSMILRMGIARQEYRG
jgi:formate hydrogenlyase transcriptional activator